MLVSLLSVLLVALIVPFVAKTEDYRVQLQSAEDARVRAEVTTRLRDAELAALGDHESNRNTKLNGEISSLTAEIARLSEELQTSRAQFASSKAENANNDASLARLSASHRQFSAIVDSMRAELNQRRGQALTQQKKSIELADENDRVQAELESLTRQVRQYQEQTVALEDRNAGLEKMFSRLDPAIRQQVQGDQGGRDSVTPFMPDFQISGAITQVQAMDDETFLQVNVGANDGIEKNMKFWVHRGDTFVGNMVITVVDADAASGRMILLEENQQVVAGDAVTTGGM